MKEKSYLFYFNIFRNSRNQHTLLRLRLCFFINISNVAHNYSYKIMSTQPFKPIPPSEEIGYTHLTPNSKNINPIQLQISGLNT